MYEALDPFLQVETWHTTHWCDDERFYEALKNIAEKPAFDPEKMGEYMRNYHGIKAGSPLDESIQSRVSQAWTITDYLKTVNK